jgi:hypothetical protein
MRVDRSVDLCHDHDPTPSAATGTVMRRSLHTEYAISARFGEVEILPIEDFSLFRFYWCR